MGNTVYEASQFALGIVEKIMANSITFSGEKNLNPNAPTLFVSNHFTRIETFLLPFVIYKKLGFKVRSLADHTIFTSATQDYLNAVGTVSTKDRYRNEKILGDLLTGRNNWLIYPEGFMIKSKKVVIFEDTFMIENPKGLHDIFTGSAVLALKSELEKSRYFEVNNRCDTEAIKEFKENYFIEEKEELSYNNTVIIPVNVSYSPIRKGQNNISSFAHKYIDAKSESVEEEIEIESNLLLNSQVHVHFSKPIDVKAFLFHTKQDLKKEKLELDDESIIERARIPLTNMMMSEVYKNILITFDHLFGLCLEYMSEDEFSVRELKVKIYLVSRELERLAIYHLDKALGASLCKLLNDEPHALFDDIFKVAQEQNIITFESNKCTINRENFKNEHTFHTIRVKNTLRVLINETIILHELHECVKYNIQKDMDRTYKEVFYIIYNRDIAQFKHDYNKFYSVFESKPKEIGKPFILYDEKNSVGCVISHGYKSAPREIEPLAHYLFANGINVYGVRLKGHATMPEDLRDTKYEEWYDSFDIGYTALSCVSKKIFLCGFSTGGLIALLKSANANRRIDGVICINSAISLDDIHAKYISGNLSVVDSFLSLFDSDYDTYESQPEYPEFNYKRHYTSSIGEWKKLIDNVSKRLKNISSDALIIQADNDPIVDPRSADYIYDKIASSQKEKFMVNGYKHVSLLDKSVNQEIFEKITKFIKYAL